MGKEKIENSSEFFIEQIKTTKKIIHTFSKTDEFSPTMLINSLLSLVVLPFESAKVTNGEKIFPGGYKDLEKKLSFSPVIFQPIKSCDENNITYSNKTIYSYINKFRNGIAHQNLNVLVDEDKVIYITIYNKYTNTKCKKCKQKTCLEKGLQYNKSGIVDFKITVTVSQLQKLALYIADSYLKAIDGTAIGTVNKV